MRTRCPACRTVFRVTAEQLRLKSGKVRCGYCHAVFNALDELIDDSAARGAVSAAAEPIPLSPEDSVAVDAAEYVETLLLQATELAGRQRNDDLIRKGGLNPTWIQLGVRYGF